jgi:hypothetical protein
MSIDNGLQIAHNNKIVPLPENYVVEIPANEAGAGAGAGAARENRLITYLLEGVGWSGSILVLIPYIFTFEKSIDFALNTAGASGLPIICIKSRQFQSIAINAAWLIGGIYKYFV